MLALGHDGGADPTGNWIVVQSGGRAGISYCQHAQFGYIGYRRLSYAYSRICFPD